MTSNFDFMAKYWPDIAQIGKMAELYLYADANACIYKIGVLAERIAQEICAFEKINLPEQTSHADRLRALKYEDILPKRIDDIFYTLRKARNDAVHAGLDSSKRAGVLLHLAFTLCGWFMEVYGEWNFQIPEYHAPEDSSQNEDFAQRLQAQEEKIQALMEAVEEIRTVASAVSRDDRAVKAEEAARNLPLTQEETDCIGDDPVRIDIAVLPVINYAMQQNGASVIQSITIENHTDTPLQDVELQITATPAFSLPFVHHIKYMPAKRSVTLSETKLLLNGDYLAGMTEKVTGILSIRLSSEGTVLASDNVETTILAFDEWHGMGLYPEMLAAFITPNHPVLAKIIVRASEILGQWTGDTSMDAYQSQDPNRALSQAGALFTALKEQRIAYVVPPASFERCGQRVRLCDMVLEQKLGTCLDLTLLYAACLEAVGLHPLLIVGDGHIFTGVWLENQMFPECVQDDASLITKRLASGVNEIAVVETTCVTSGKNMSFDEARTIGEQNLSARPVECIIDVRRARLSHISPLPQRVHIASGWVIEHETPYKEEHMAAPRELHETIHVDLNSSGDNIPKKVQWERKLLDLGMRNTLINLRLTKTQLPILINSLDGLEDALADGGDFSIMPRPADWRVGDVSFEKLHEMGTAGIIQAEFENKRLRSVLTEAELTTTIKNLYRMAKTALEENGANTLYLALGMLRWFENKRSTKARYAPIILLPIEMVRKSAAKGYVIRMRDEEPQMNITLLEKLKQDFGILIGGLDPLPSDEHGIDIRKVLTILRKAVMEQPHWDVLETASIGIFSFSQFVMWNDIRNRTDDLMRNKVVRSLIEGKLTWDAKPMELGQRVEEDDVLLPVPADASQLYAIRAACDGESFVLHGPPGTGKSQTITSLIVNALAQGKKVLFVAEKMAALEVVQKRLEQIGIGPFCLELHSNKSKKKDVLEQLRQAAEVTKTRTAEEYTQQAKQIAEMRAELDDYARQLHQDLPCGSSLYTLIDKYETYRDAPEIVPFDQTFVHTLDKQAIERQRLAVERLVAAGREVGHPNGHPLYPVTCTQYTQSMRGSLQTVTEEYQTQLRIVGNHAKRLSAALEEEDPANFDELQRLANVGAHMACWYDMPHAWTQANIPQTYYGELIQMAQHYEVANQLEQQLLQSFTPDFLTMDGEALLAEVVQNAGKWFLPRMLGMNGLRGRINVFAKEPVNKDDLQRHITALRDFQRESKAADKLFERYGSDLGAFYRGKETDWKALEQLAATAQQNAQELYALCGSYDVLYRHCGDPELREAVYGLWGGISALAEAKQSFDKLLGIAETTQAHWLDGQMAFCQTVLDYRDEMKEWIAYVGAAQEARELGLTNVVSGYESGVAHEDVFRAYQKALLQELIFDAIDESGTLNHFSGAVFNEKIGQYKRMDQRWMELSRKEIYCRLAGKVPDFTREAAQSSELGILQRCIRCGGRGTSIRKLFDQIPNLLPRLCPCMLMSPISAAQYLDPKREPFDLVVFDEASQLPTCKAVGVLARGRNAVIVGDPKQMPPTSFFATNTVDEDNLDAEDLESILDDCLALNMPQTHLLWHYRSRHESLIAFSNRQFYENRLLTFPSVNDRESKVRLVHVDGVFERGKSRKNRAEAEAVVDELRRRCHDPELASQSVGVVTFNIPQQNLIDDLLNEACAQDQALEQWAFGTEEGVFIKNLENVQGDERDVILFSIGYGPDQSGKVSMNFGPLNRDGGWRRLNVAVSRARFEMVVFSTLRADQIDLNRTKAEGVIALRNFLAYAEGRTLALDEITAQMEQHPHRGVAAAICRALNVKGYETELSVGCSKYRIDIGVVDPRDPERYILGILLDGISYGTAKTTRDREIAQISVLNGLGWNLLRVWSMDWWDNRDKELNRILDRLKELENRPPVAENAVRATESIKKQQPLESEQGPERKLASATSALSVNRAVAEYATVSPGMFGTVYTAAVVPAKFLSAELFLEPRYRSDIEKKIQMVLDVEAPVSAPVLIKRVVQSYSIARVGSRIQGHMDTILQKMKLKSTNQGGAVFYWKEEQNPDAYVGFRTNGEGDHHRDVRDVPVQEVANAVYAVLYEQVSMAKEDLLRETARKLGYTRMGGNVLSAMESGIQFAQSQGGIGIGANGTYVLSAGGTARAEASH